MSKKRRKTPARQQPQEAPEVVYLTEFEITTEPMEDRRYKRLPKHVKEAFERLHYLAQSQPRQAIPELLSWIERYPDIPMLYNYLSMAYSAAGQYAEAEAVIRTNYQQNPDYLFARLNYAELCLAEGDYAQVAEIFQHKFTLTQLYPNRRRFHISEVANFMGFLGIYFFRIGQQDTARSYYELLQEIAPDFPVVKELRRLLFPGPLRRLLMRRAGRPPADS